MFQYTLRRLGFLLLTLLITSLIVFIIAQVLPGDVARVILGREAKEEAVQNLRNQLGLNDPIPVQYVRWLGNFVRGNWGFSYSQQNKAIFPLVMERLTRSFWLAGLTLLIAIPLSVLLGVIAGLNAGKTVDGAISI